MIVSRTRCLLAVALVAATFSAAQADRPVVPGTGVFLPQVGDDFEDDAWNWVPNLPKSSKNLNEFTGGRGGQSSNDRWYEGVKRGQPDQVQRVATPAGGIEGSKGALLLRSLRTGVPGRPSFKLQQDDFICNVHLRLNGRIPVHQTPNFMVRVFLPPFDQWEERNGCSFAIRASVDTRTNKSTGGFFNRSSFEREEYWPGLFLVFKSKERSRAEKDSAYISIRSDQRGFDIPGPEITQTGWWTFGMSFTPDGQVHYYARPGVDDLTADDYITSQFPYGYRCERFMTFFFNVCNGDDGRTWSTPWVIDDPKMFFVPTTASGVGARRR